MIKFGYIYKNKKGEDVKHKPNCGCSQCKSKRGYNHYEVDIKLLEQYDFRCGYCGFDFLRDPYAFKDTEFDHIIPRKRGGGEGDNRIPACHFCNSVKRVKIFKNLDKAKAELKKLREEFLVKFHYYQLRKKYRE